MAANHGVATSATAWLRTRALNESTAVMPISAWMTDSAGSHRPRIRRIGAASALPSAMPVSTHASMMVKA